MSDITLNVELREKTGTGPARAVRRADRVPGILYGGDLDPVAISIESRELRKAISRGGFRSHMIKITHKGESQPVIVRDIQFDPLSDAPVHLDLYRVKEDQIISVEVPVTIVGEERSPGLKRGGALNLVRHAIELDCPANAIPEKIEISVAGLEIGDSVHISAIALPQNVTPTITDRDFTVVTIAGKGATEEEEASAAEAPVETEVIKKGKAEDEGGDEKKAKEKKDD